MKKIFVLSLVIMICLINAVVYASSYNVELIGPKTVNAGSEFEVIIKLKDLTDINGTANGINVVMLTMSFDESKLEKKEVTGLNGFIVTEGAKLVIDKAEGVSTDTEIAKIKFKAKETLVTGNTSIELKNISSSNGSNDIASSDVSMIISINNDNNTNTEDDTNTDTEGDNNTGNNTNTDDTNTGNNGNQSNTNTNNNSILDNKESNSFNANNTNVNNNNNNKENIAKGILPNTGTNIANRIILLLIVILSRIRNMYIY